jgi:carbonic anhydrase
VSHFQALIARNEAFARSSAHQGLSIIPRQPVYVVCCLDPRTDPAAFLGIELGDAVVVRNAGGRVTDEIIRDIAFISYLAETMLPEGPLFEVSVIHHNECGTGFLAGDEFRRAFANRTGIDESALAEEAVIDPITTVKTDVARLLRSPMISRRITVSGHVYDVESGLVTVVLPASHPLSSDAPSSG